MHFCMRFSVTAAFGYDSSQVAVVSFVIVCFLIGPSVKI